jgi:hypothetical protein
MSPSDGVSQAGHHHQRARSVAETGLDRGFELVANVRRSVALLMGWG